MARKTSNKKNGATPVYESYVEKLEGQVESNQSRLSMILGALIVLVVGILVFNYFNKNSADLGPAQQTQMEEDVSPENLPGKYTVKEDDTLFTVAEKYYKDGYKFTEIAKANNISNPDQIEVGQVLEIPKIEEVPVLSEAPAIEEPSNAAPGSKGAPDVTMMQQSWGPEITSNTYTVVEGDWLSKIAGRAYGNIYAYDRIAKANNIANPDLIEPGQVLTIPR